MLNRWIGIITAALMVLANGAVLFRDVLPDWMATDAPPSPVARLAPGEEFRVQVGIFDKNDKNVGRSWTYAKKTTIGGIVEVSTTTILRPIHLPQGLVTPSVRVETKLTYRQDQAFVDDLQFHMFGLGLPISLHAEAMASGEFPFTWQIGERTGKVILDSQAPIALGDVIRPFDRLPNLYVGRTWRLDLLDPLSQMLPNLNARQLGLDAVLIQVTGTEVIEHGGQAVEVFVVEGHGATAWADREGRVLRQEVTLPLLGRLILLDEPYDPLALAAAIRAVPR